MILAFDTYYFENKAKTVCLAFESWTNCEKHEIYTEILEGIEDYISGEFYKRELPCIMSLYAKINIENVEAIIIDGFVFLDDNEKMGLGGHLYEILDSKTPVIGVAKTNFATIKINKREVLRGKSINPLYITAIGIDLEKASELINNMSGQNRIPITLKKLDTLTKERNSG
ncbi:endonuclease V [Flavobacterium sp. ZT3R18]|uniref:endonuclease V n=1 Tax=Flavobacterium sp. ZT3R18 TaxID=2594429 RepID=UPI00117A736B|nr:endonuclease V [Flavobacterium sp. ZT3R18]TRX37452.1 endonuclease V [Flavobacterium sp. ZT3R18]